MLKHGSDIMVKSRQEWMIYGKQNKKEYIFYNGLCMDMGYFKNAHPGGSQMIKNYIFKDMTQTLYSVFPHNKQRTESILSKYVVGKIKEPAKQKTKQQGTILKSRNDLKQTAVLVTKKSVQFPSEVKKLASERQKIHESKGKSKIKEHSQSLKKNSKSINMSQFKRRDGNRKSLDPSYLQALKPQFKNRHMSQIKQKSNLLVPEQLKQFDSGSSIATDSISDSTSNVSINYRIEKNKKKLLSCQISPQLDEDVEEGHDKCKIRVPVMTVRFDRVW